MSAQRGARYIARRKGQIAEPNGHRILRDGTTITKTSFDKKRGQATVEGEHRNGSTFSFSVPLSVIAGIA